MKYVKYEFHFLIFNCEGKILLQLQHFIWLGLVLNPYSNKLAFIHVNTDLSFILKEKENVFKKNNEFTTPE